MNAKRNRETFAFAKLIDASDFLEVNKPEKREKDVAKGRSE
jgi:hypothetical protein